MRPLLHSIALIILGMFAHNIYGAPITSTSTTAKPQSALEMVDDELQPPLLSESDERSLIANIFGGTLSRDEAKLTLQRALDMLQKPRVKPAERDRRTRNMDTEAKALLRAMTGEASIGSTSDEDTEHDEHVNNDSDYCERFEFAGRRNLSMSTMRKIVELHDRGFSVRAIQAQYKWYMPKHLPPMRRCIETGGSPSSRLKDINDYVLQRVQETIQNRHPLHEYMIRNWAERRAAELGVDFRASSGWLHNFKTRNEIVSRKITEYTSRAEVNRQAAIQASIQEFRRDFSSIESQFRRAMIINMDQTGFAYEIYRDRTLTWKGSRDVAINIDQQNKRTHSYTSQPMISRDGHLIGKLLLCMQEQRGRFGPNVEQQVRQLEEKFGNIVVLASASGKMSSDLTRDWIKKVLLPAVRERITSLDTDTETISLENLSLDDDVFEEGDQSDSRLDEEVDRRCHAARVQRGREACVANERPTCLEFTQRAPICLDPYPNARCMEQLNSTATTRCYNRPHTLLLLDSWGGHSSEVMQNNLRQYGIRVLLIPKKTTGDLQPLDITFMRQYKRFVKIVVEAAILNDMLTNVTSREGIINLHSLIWNQFGSEAYTDMLRYAWRNTDESFDNSELSVRPPPPMVQEVQFNFHGSKKCEVSNCSSHAFIRCSHCRKYLCLQHFLERKCFHAVNDQRAGPSSDTEAGPSGTKPMREEYPHLFDDDDDDFDPDLFAKKRN